MKVSGCKAVCYGNSLSQPLRNQAAKGIAITPDTKTKMIKYRVNKITTCLMGKK